MDEVAERVKSRQTAHAAGLESSGQSQRQMDLEMELLERKVRLFLGRAELIEKRGDQGPPTVQSDVQNDVSAVRQKWNSLLKMADDVQCADAENERLRRQAAEVTLPLCSYLLFSRVGNGLHF